MAALGLGWAGPASAQLRENAIARACVAIDSVSIFRPRGEIYVVISSTCSEQDFAREDPVLAYLEVLLSDLPPESQDVRIYGDSPQRRQTIVFGCGSAALRVRPNTTSSGCSRRRNS